MLWLICYNNVGAIDNTSHDAKMIAENVRDHRSYRSPTKYIMYQSVVRGGVQGQQCCGCEFDSYNLHRRCTSQIKYIISKPRLLNGSTLMHNRYQLIYEISMKGVNGPGATGDVMSFGVTRRREPDTDRPSYHIPHDVTDLTTPSLKGNTSMGLWGGQHLK